MTKSVIDGCLGGSAHRRFIERNIDSLAWASRDAYLERGRGFWAASSEQVSRGSTKLVYVTVELIEEEGAGWPDDLTREKVETYAPASQCVLVFIDERGRACVHKLTFLGGGPGAN